MDEYINDELEYLQFLISSEPNKSFYSNLKILMNSKNY